MRILLFLVIALLGWFCLYYTVAFASSSNQWSEKEISCLEKNVYFEARGEPDAGKKAVVWVTLNRVKSKHYPNTICGVVKQGKHDTNGNPVKHKCSFSWYCDGAKDTIANKDAWEKSKTVVKETLTEIKKGVDSPVGNATMYHNTSVVPYWASSYKRVGKIGKHIFYR